MLQGRATGAAERGIKRAVAFGSAKMISTSDRALDLTKFLGQRVSSQDPPKESDAAKNADSHGKKPLFRTVIRCRHVCCGTQRVQGDKSADYRCQKHPRECFENSNHQVLHGNFAA